MSHPAATEWPERVRTAVRTASTAHCRLSRRNADAADERTRSDGFSDLTDGITYHAHPADSGRERFFGYTVASAGQNARDFILTAILLRTCWQVPQRRLRGEPTIQQSPH